LPGAGHPSSSAFSRASHCGGARKLVDRQCAKQTARATSAQLLETLDFAVPERRHGYDSRPTSRNARMILFHAKTS